ncbi:uncharacterized protein LOC114285860 isoform X2 [Camellia sinensis]|uniref:uncharacterized protein LOC114285860 isoform X2 n=1 Tax=Camellia sinensis TaxID=4442 RepID=UPI001035BC3D|nr:uncharacterized protein LOC114285860 isoform X2 [Camellia sinensis]
MRSESPTTMGLTCRDCSSNSVILRSSSSTKNNKKSSSNQREDRLCARNPSIRLQIHELNPLCKSRKKAEEDDEDGDFDKRFGEEGSFDDDKYMWLSSEDVDLATGAADEPLFWPSDRKFDWGSELKWDFFIMSPRKHKHKDKTLEGKLTFVRRMQTQPSRMGESRNFFAKIVPLDVVEPTSDDVLNEKSNLVDEDFESNEEVAIETLLGLDEFDGHEGTESEFNKDDFCLDESV